MTALLGLNAYQSEALIACLAASVLWAGALLLGALHLERSGTARGDRLWIGVLLLAILPSLAAPSLAAFGVSLRKPSAAPAIVEIAPPADARAASTDFAPAPDSRAETKPVAANAVLPTITAGQAISALSLLYVYGAFLALFIWLARQAGFLAASALAEPVRNESLLNAVDDWAFEFGVKTPALKRSRHVSSVCVYGAVSPVILMPHDLDVRVATDDIALMCAHEIAHLKRGDTRLFTATALARVLFWFNPLVTRIAANVEMAAEEGADRLVIDSGVDRRAYASCFVKGLKYAAMKQSLLPALAPGFTPNDRQGRRRRLDQILSADGERRATAGARAMLAGAASIAALLAVGQAAFAVDPEAAAEKKRLAVATKTDDVKAPPAPSFAKPVDGEVTLPFGKTYKSLVDDKTPVEHKGVDFKAAKGAPVKASARGVVVEATTRLPGEPSYGTTVIIDHGHGLISRYAHLDSYSVKIGQAVRKGDVIGAVGETGLVTGPHLHFEVLKNGKPVDPSLAFAPAAPEPPSAPVWADAADAPEPPAPVPPSELAEPVEPVEPVIVLSDEFTDPAIHYVFKGMDGFAFGNGDTLTDRMAADLEHLLLGDIEIADGAVYDISFTLNGETHRFTSGDPMTPEKRAKMKAVIDDMRVQREKARKEMDKGRTEWRQHVEKRRANASTQAAAMKRDFAGTSAKVEHYAIVWPEDEEAARREIDEARLEAMETERAARESAVEAERLALEAEFDALSDARGDLEDAINDGLDEAIADLDAEEAALDAEEVSEEDRRIMRLALAEARRNIELSRRDHEREIERARRELERRAAEIERQLEALDDKLNDGN
jgi:murein DD-endopeptidase MepM/ murein hydrolase activator NlpD